MKITGKLEALVGKLAGSGKSNAAIARALGAKGVTVTAQAVGQYLQKRRTERADVAKVVAREKLTRGLTADLDALAMRTTRLRTLCIRLERVARSTHDNKLISSGTVRALLMAHEQFRKQVETNLHFAGADQPDEQVDGLAGFLASAFALSAHDHEHDPEPKAPTLQ